MEKKLVNGLTVGRVNRFFGILLAIFLSLGGLLYWQGYLKERGLILVGIITVVAGISFTFGTRVAQKDGFLDGYVRAKDEIEKKKKV